jgi:hypothetical protein
VTASAGFAPEDWFDFWKAEASKRVSDPEGVSNNDGTVTYWASLWIVPSQTEDLTPTVLLEAHH